MTRLFTKVAGKLRDGSLQRARDMEKYMQQRHKLKNFSGTWYSLVNQMV